MREQLLKLFHQRTKWSLDELRKTLNVKSAKDLTTLVKTLNQLVDDKKIANNHANYFLIKSNDVIGKVKDISKFEYAIIGEDKKVYVDKKYARSVFDGDEVLAQNVNGTWKITQIYTRGIQMITGEFIHTKNGFLFRSDIDFHRSFQVKNINSFKIQNHDKAVVKILKYDDPMVVEITELLGNAKDPGVDITSILIENRARLTFSKKVVDEVKKIPDHVVKSDYVNRKDLTDLLTFTIDGDDAKDFDDAISIVKKKYGYTLYVHIADVSHYVKAGSFLDQEAYARCTSIYVCDRVVPMLPFELSNGICSLNPNVKRNTITCQMEIDEHGSCTSYKIYPSMIQSNQRCTYNKVNACLNGNLKTIQEYCDVYESLVVLADCCTLLQQRSHDRGNIDFNTKEPFIQLNKKGRPVSISIKERGFAEQMIEECMILANVCVANYLHSHHLPCMYRIHEKPDEEKIVNLENACHLFGRIFDFEDVSSKTIQCLLESIDNDQEYEVISRIALRSMQKARYSQECIGHFGLSLDEYCHFTSPIRRYADLVVHRMLRKYLFEEQTEGITKDCERIEKQAFQMSQKEKDAILIERKVNDYEMAQYMEGHIGQCFEGTIISVMEFGFFVELENCIEGLVPIRTLRDDFYVYDELRMSFTGDLKSYRIGQKVKVMVEEVNVAKGQISFIVQN